MNQLTLEIRMPSEIDFFCGTKATTLLELKNIGLLIPDFYAIPSSCFASFCREMKIQSLEAFYLCGAFDPDINKKFLHTEILNMDNIIRKVEDGKYMVRSSSVPADDVDLKMFPSMISGAFESYFASSISEVTNNIPNVWRSVFFEKAYNQCRLFSKTPIIKGVGVLIQKYIEPIISGVAHTKDSVVSVNWIKGHLSKIVNGETLGNSIDVYMSAEQNYILRGIENDILSIKNNNYENVFRTLWDNAISIKQYFGCNQEVEWIYDGEEVWIVQSQSLIPQK